MKFCFVRSHVMEAEGNSQETLPTCFEDGGRARSQGMVGMQLQKLDKAKKGFSARASQWSMALLNLNCCSVITDFGLPASRTKRE